MQCEQEDTTHRRRKHNTLKVVCFRHKYVVRLSQGTNQIPQRIRIVYPWCVRSHLSSERNVMKTYVLLE